MDNQGRSRTSIARRKGWPTEVDNDKRVSPSEIGQTVQGKMAQSLKSQNKKGSLD